MQYFYDTIEESVSENTNSLSTITYGKASITGIIETESWEHPNGTLMTDYILKLDTPINVQTQSELYTNIDEVQFWTSDLDEKYIGKHVKADGYIRGQAGTIYYRRNVVIENAQISILDSDEQLNTERGFDITRDGWPFLNVAESFEYEEDYKIPVEQWVASYGEAIKPIAEKFTGKWSGNCYGMSSLAACIYSGIAPYDNEKEINEIISGTKKYKDTDIDILKCSLATRRVIERYQISQYSKEYSDVYDDILSSNLTYAGMFYDVVKSIKDENKTFLVLGSAPNNKGESVGHAMVTDTSREIEISEDGWCKIYLYDPNNPYYDNNERYNLASQYKDYDDRYVRINYKTGEWFLELAQNADSSEIYCTNYDKNKKINTNPSESDSQLLFEDYSWQKDYRGFDYTMDYDGRWYESLYASASNLEILDSNSSILISIKDGKITKQADTVFVQPIINLTVNSSNIFEGKISFKNKIDKIELTDGSITALGNDKITQVSTDNHISFVINNNNSNIELTSNHAATIDVVMENVDDRDIYDALSIEGEISKDEKIKIENQEGDYDINTNTKNLFDIKYENNDEILTAEDVDLSTWDGTYDNSDKNTDGNNWTESTQSQINNTSAYLDVKSTDSYFNAINLLSEMDVISGYNDGTFKPDNKVTRAEFTKLVVAALGSEQLYQARASAGIDTQFSDVPGSHWAAGYISSGVNSGLIDGMGDGTFAPDANVTYMQAMKILVCAAGYAEWSEDAGGWPDGYLKYANEAGIGNGVTASKDTAVTRGQVVQMIYNAIQAPVVVIKGFNGKDSKGNALLTMEKKDGTGSDYQSILTLKHNIYTAEGFMKNEDAFVITSSINFNNEYYPENSKETIEIYTPYDVDQDSNKQVKAFIECDEDDDYYVIYMN